MTSPKPTIVIVPGAWHLRLHYQKLIDTLEGQRYEVLCEENPSLVLSNAKEQQTMLDEQKQDTARDAAHIKDKLILPQIDAGKDVILVMHSYGGIPGSAAAHGLSKAERKDKKGAVIGLIYIAAFLVSENQSLLGAIGGKHMDWAKWVGDDERSGLLEVDEKRAQDVLYHDVEDVLAKEMIKELKVQVEAALSTPSGPPAWGDAGFDGRRAYIKCKEDRTIPYNAQTGMVTMVSSKGHAWVPEDEDIDLDMDSSHSPFLSQPGTLGKTIVELAKKFAKPETLK